MLMRGSLPRDSNCPSHRGLLKARQEALSAGVVKSRCFKNSVVCVLDFHRLRCEVQTALRSLVQPYRPVRQSARGYLKGVVMRSKEISNSRPLIKDRGRFGALTQFRNPLPLILDRAGLIRAPYVVESRSGVKIAIRPQTGDRFTAYETFGIGVYDLGTRLIKRGDIIIDVGANIGCFAILAGKLAGNSGRVIAIEPAQVTFDHLVGNIGRNAPVNIEPKLAAVAGQSGTLEIHIPERNTLFSSMYPVVDGHQVGGKTQSVTCLTLGELLENERIGKAALLKLDCEGAEHEIIDTLTTDTAAKIDNILVEFHSVNGHVIGDKIEKLKMLGYFHSYRHNHLFYRTAH
jgi:FkbM family methyltransferase